MGDADIDDSIINPLQESLVDLKALKKQLDALSTVASPSTMVARVDFQGADFQEGMKRLKEMHKLSDEATKSMEALALQNANFLNVVTGGNSTVQDYNRAIKQLTSAALDAATNGQEKLANELANVGNEMKLELQYAQQLVAGNSALTQSLQGFMGVSSSVTSGLQAAAGAFALFGASDQSVQKAIKDLLALQAVVNGLKGFSNLSSSIQKFSTALAHLTGVAGKSAKELSTWGKMVKGAVAAAGPAVVVILALAAAAIAVAQKIKGAREETAKFNEEVRKLTYTSKDVTIAFDSLRDSYKQLTDEQKGSEDVYEQYISELNSIGVKATTAADAEKALNTELAQQILHYQQQLEDYKKDEEAVKNLAKANDELRDAQKRVEDSNMGKRQAKKYLEEYINNVNIAQAAVNNLGTSEQDLAIERRNNAVELAKINSQMTKQKPGNGGGGKVKRELPGKTAADMQKFIDVTVKNVGPQ